MINDECKYLWLRSCFHFNSKTNLESYRWSCSLVSYFWGGKKPHKWIKQRRNVDFRVGLVGNIGEKERSHFNCRKSVQRRSSLPCSQNYWTLSGDLGKWFYSRCALHCPSPFKTIFIFLLLSWQWIVVKKRRMSRFWTEMKIEII